MMESNDLMLQNPWPPICCSFLCVVGGPLYNYQGVYYRRNMLRMLAVLEEVGHAQTVLGVCSLFDDGTGGAG